MIKMAHYTTTWCTRDPLYSFTSWAPVLTQSSRWKIDEIREDAKQRGITPPDKRTAREHCLNKGVEVPDLAAVKDFLRFQASVMRGKIKQTLGIGDKTLQ